MTLDGFEMKRIHVHCFKILNGMHIYTGHIEQNEENKQRCVFPTFKFPTESSVQTEIFCLPEWKTSYANV